MSTLPLPATIAIVGVSFYQDNVAHVTVGDAITAVAEPDNPHDQHAFVVANSGGDTLGHLPAVLAQRLSSEGIQQLEGYVRQVLDARETVGLRVHFDRPGANNSVSADIGRNETADETTAGDTELVEEDTASRADLVLVFTNAGRKLGPLAEITDSKVFVRSPGGTVVGYPKALVTVADHAAVSPSR